MRQYVAVIAAGLLLTASPIGAQDHARQESHARNVTITRDTWGIPHIHGKSDADAVFGMIYAQAEDDFNRVEMNYVRALGRLAELEGADAIYEDLRQRLYFHPDTLRRRYTDGPEWLRVLMDAWADGLNYYLRTHPEVTPRLLTRFEPWMALSFTEGSIGGDIENAIWPEELEAFYGNQDERASPESSALRSRAGRSSASNGIAIGPSRTVNGRTLLLINPHTSFYFRTELQMTSDEGLNAYGAATWGQFFIYQGFNERAGWMHTSTRADAIDAYLETIVRRGDELYYRYGTAERPVVRERVTIRYRTDTGMATRDFEIYKTHHGPITLEQDGQWVAIRLLDEPVEALTQSWLRMKARNYGEFRRTMQLHTNSSNNTIFADAAGNIAYFHANFVPRRDVRFDWDQMVDGSDPATEWGPPHGIDETPHVVNPDIGWVYNANDWPWTSAGPDSPRPENYPYYVDAGFPSPRGRLAVQLLEKDSSFSMASLQSLAFDRRILAADDFLPVLFRAYEVLPGADSLRARLTDQIRVLRAWDRRASATSVATSLFVYLLETRLPPPFNVARFSWDSVPPSRAARQPPQPASAEQLLLALAEASDKLTAEFGTWRTPWGDINRFQRISGEIDARFDDAASSLPVDFVDDLGTLPVYGAEHVNTKRRYGTYGNTFVAVVEFGSDSVRARAITPGGQSSNPASPHFNDQSLRYITGDLRDVYFYPAQLEKHTERRYRPGKR